MLMNDYGELEMKSAKEITGILENYILRDTIQINEYQDKYYFVKKISGFFPDIKEDILYRALERLNDSFPGPVKRKIFIDRFVSEIIKLNLS